MTLFLYITGFVLTWGVISTMDRTTGITTATGLKAVVCLLWPLAVWAAFLMSLKW